MRGVAINYLKWDHKISAAYDGRMDEFHRDPSSFKINQFGDNAVESQVS